MTTPKSNDQGSLFHPAQSGGWRRPPHNGTETSKAAADAIVGDSRTLRARVFGFLIERGVDGATDEEIQHALGMACQTETPRRRELVKMHLVRDSERKRKTSSGRRAKVWIAITTPQDGRCDERG